VEIAGIVQVGANGELELGSSEVASEGSSTTVGSVAMSGKSLGGAQLGLQPGVTGGSGANNVGLQVQTWGTVRYASSTAPYYFVVDDGSGATDPLSRPGVGVRSGTIAPPTQGTFVNVRGVCSYESGYPVILLRQSGDWW